MDNVDRYRCRFSERMHMAGNKIVKSNACLLFLSCTYANVKAQMMLKILKFIKANAHLYAGCFFLPYHAYTKKVGRSYHILVWAYMFWWQAETILTLLSPITRVQLKQSKIWCPAGDKSIATTFPNLYRWFALKHHIKTSNFCRWLHFGQTIVTTNEHNTLQTDLTSGVTNGTCH